jgi:LmbE family N-acetylglucosaminyl deacetylase
MQSAINASANPFTGRHVMMVVAHPDDETLAAGIALTEARHITLVHTTDGAESLYKAKCKGFSTRSAYAEARREELRHALCRIADKTQFVFLGFRDRRAAFHIAEIAAALLALLGQHKPDIVVTHAFEGGHPDHDATAMATHLAVRTLASPPLLLESPGYNRATGTFVFGQFIPQDGIDLIVLPLSPGQQSNKRKMLAAFSSQDDVVPFYPLDAELFRPAPRYDFDVKPHLGLLNYEDRCLPMTWQVWRLMSRRAQQAFEHGVPVSGGFDFPLRWYSTLKNIVLKAKSLL